MQLSRPQLIRRSYTALVVYVLLSGFISLLSHSIFSTRFLRDAGVVTTYSWAVVIPVALITIWILNWKYRKLQSNKQAWAIWIAKLFLFIAWLYSMLAVVIYIAITQPWPFSMKHGPDTEYSNSGFTQHMGFAPPKSVNEIYYRNDSGWQDSFFRFRFTASNADVVQQIINQRKLLKSETPKLSMATSKNPDWWREKGNALSFEFYYKDQGHYFCRLWHDFVTGRVWYEEYTM